MLCEVNLCLNSILQIRHEENRKLFHFVFGILYSRGTVEWMPNCSPLWSLTSICVALILVWFLNGIKEDGFKYAVIIICPLISYAFSCFDIVKLPRNIDTALMGVLFIEVGILLRKRFNTSMSYMPLPVAVGILIPIGYIVININPVDAVSFDNNKYGNIILMIVGSLLTIVVVIVVLQKLCMRFKCRYLSFLGKYTIFIMEFDYFSGTVAGVILRKIGHSNWLMMFVLKLLLLTGGILSWITIAKQVRNISERKLL